MLYDTSPIIISSDKSTVIDACSCYKIHHLLSMHGHVILYITYHRCIVMLYDTSPTIDAWPCHMIQCLLSMHDNVIWFITYYDAWSCYVICCICILLYLHIAICLHFFMCILLYPYTSVCTYGFLHMINLCLFLYYRKWNSTRNFNCCSILIVVRFPAVSLIFFVQSSLNLIRL